jgi:hypothetical protein
MCENSSNSGVDGTASHTDPLINVVETCHTTIDHHRFNNRLDLPPTFSEMSFHTAGVPRGTAEEKEVFESVVTPGEMEAGPAEPPCRGRL